MWIIILFLQLVIIIIIFPSKYNNIIVVITNPVPSLAFLSIMVALFFCMVVFLAYCSSLKHPQLPLQGFSFSSFSLYHKAVMNGALSLVLAGE